MNDRERALALLRRIERESLYASLALQNDSGFVRTLVLGVLRWRSRLDFVIAALAVRRIEPEILDVLRLGAFQLLFTDTAQYAAVGETVELAPRRARGFVNAILRRISRGEAPEPNDVATRTAHPQWLFERWARFYGKERAEKIAAADQEMSYPDVLALGEDVPPESEKSQLVEGIWRLHGSSAALDRNAFWPMDEGSAVIAAIAANAGSEVLDLAAAPGGKSIYLASRGASVVSNDLSIARLQPLIARDRRHVIVSDARTPTFARRFQTVLLDAPCSATGTIRKNPEIKWRLRERDLAVFPLLQRDLLASALELASETVVYSTCSLEPEENDAVVASVLASDASFEIADIRAFVPPGAAAWIDDGVLHLTPESGADGFTVHVLRRR